MLPEERDAAYLWDMLQTAREIIEMNRGATYDTFIDDLKLMRATERSLEIIGEAARNVSPAFTGRHVQIAWRAMIGQRNIIAHEYGQIDYELLYHTVTGDVPDLIGQLEILLRDIGDGE